MSGGFQQVDIGMSGRRAMVWLLKNGLTILATDADAAGHAIAVVVEQLRKVGRSLPPAPFEPWTRELLAEFPALHDRFCQPQLSIAGF